MTQLSYGDDQHSGLRLFNLFGIEIRLDWSVLIIFALIVFSLGGGVFPEWHPDWTASTIWVTALIAGVLFFASLVAHELSHSLMARHYGIRVPRITLFLFGGMAEIEAEARNPKEDFNIAVVGPLMSAALGLLFSSIASLAMSEAGIDNLADSPQAVMSQLSPAATACLWLGSVNMLLAIFNLMPGFPMDGGRVFRALIWWATGDAIRATRIAANAGMVVALVIIGLGFWNILAYANLGGLWLVLIGWFLSHMARMSYTQLVTEHNLQSTPVEAVMRTRFDTVPSTTGIEEFIEDYLLRSNQQLWPVTDGDRFLGTVSFDDIRSLERERRSESQVRDLLKPLDQQSCLDADEKATAALRRLGGRGEEPLAVLRNGSVVGLLSAGDILRWSRLQGREKQE